MGNKLIAETMFRHDPDIILDAPLHTAIYESTSGGVQFSIDQPSTKFDSSGVACHAERPTRLPLALDRARLFVGRVVTVPRRAASRQDAVNCCRDANGGCARGPACS
ncbi:DUF302 domain-containing protein [Mycobacterium sp. 1245499.0]|uniref:DUF302 domain-containing protein n=1 Tax=Mycobacterium sp. 1245499.0 TaxID=1834074 RepID=UPI00350EDF0C